MASCYDKTMEYNYLTLVKLLQVCELPYFRTEGTRQAEGHRSNRECSDRDHIHTVANVRCQIKVKEENMYAGVKHYSKINFITCSMFIGAL